MPNPTKTFTPLSEIPKANIGKCAAVLPNKMQCWRAGEVQVSLLETIPAPAEDRAKDAKKDTSKQSATALSFYQLCTAHAAIEFSEYNQAVATESAQNEQDSTQTKS